MVYATASAMASMGTRGRTTPKRIAPVPRVGGKRWIAKVAAVAAAGAKRATHGPITDGAPRADVYLRHILVEGGWLRSAHRRAPSRRSLGASFLPRGGRAHSGRLDFPPSRRPIFI
jgi:hypothetical protein